ncbi:MAG TPA: tetratricopeptide repeat protein, partial [Anaeromyxobacter sp.]
AAKRTPPPDLPPAISRFGTLPQDPSPTVELREDPGLTIEVEEPTIRADAVLPPDPGASWGLPPAPAGDHAGKGVGWRKPARQRSGEAQASFDRARAEFLAGNVNGAIALLRSALAAAPGDPEIAEVLGRLAFRDREPGAR